MAFAPRADGALQRLAALALATLIALMLVLVPTGAPALAQSEGNGLAESSTTTYTVDPQAGVVRVRIEARLRNVTVDQRDGNLIRRRFFDSYFAVLPAGARNPVATARGSTLSGQFVDEQSNEEFSVYRFDLGSNLFSGQSTTVVITYDHAGLPPRSELPWRANAAYVSFLAFGIGDPGEVTIEVVLPAGYSVDTFSDIDGFQRSTNDSGDTVYTAADVDEDFDAVFSISDEERLVVTDLEPSTPSGTAPIRILSWPGDEEWLAFKTERIETGLPRLVELIGQPWPVDERLTIRQTVEPEVHGYAGWFDSRNLEISMGESIDADTLYHELSHAWLGFELFDERWILEGLAQVFAAEAVRLDGETPYQPLRPRTSDRGYVPLVDFGDFTGRIADDDAAAREGYGYETSFWVMAEIVDEIGFDRLRAALDVVFDEAPIYPDDGDVDVFRPGVTDSPRWFDALEIVGGSERAAALFTEWVDPGFADQLPVRAERRSQFADLLERAAPWATPQAVRTPLETWDWDTAATAMDNTSELLDLRDERDALHDRIDVEIHDSVGPQFGSADLSVSRIALQRELEAATDLVATLDTTAALGERLNVAPPTPAALVTELDIASAADIADGEYLHDQLQEAADDQLEAFDAVADAVIAADGERSLLQRIGLLGSGLDDDLGAAREALAAVDHDTAEAAAADAQATLAAAESVGTQRAVGAAIVASVLALLTFFVVRRRRAAARRRALDADIAALALLDGAGVPPATPLTDAPAASSAPLAPPTSAAAAWTEPLAPPTNGLLPPPISDEVQVAGDAAASRSLFAAVNREDLDEDALPGAGLGSVNDGADVAVGDDRKAP